MKVKCIAPPNWVKKGEFVKKWFWGKKKEKNCKGPLYGDIVTVENEYYNDGIKFYCLVEWPAYGGYDSKWFIPIEPEAESVTFEKITKENPVSVN